MKTSTFPRDTVYWYIDKKPSIKKLNRTTTVNVAIVGGGAAGLAAAYAFNARGLSVALLEKEFCGAGATGKSSGFISPDSELESQNLISRWGRKNAQKLWDFSGSGAEALRSFIFKYSLSCDYQEQETLFIANGLFGLHEVTQEHTARSSIQYSSIFYDQDTLATRIGSPYYLGAVGDKTTFGINAYAYCQEFKQVLEQEGVKIYENTHVVSINDHKLYTPRTSINADYIIVAIDRFLPALQKLTHDIYHAQTFLLLSKPLSDAQLHTLFPKNPCMITDTALVFNYYRVTGEQRLLLGGADLFNTYACCENHHATRVYRKLTQYFYHKFPQLSLDFEYMWPGLIGISKDLLPIAEPDPKFPHVYYISAATGLSWATALGLYSAQRLLDNTTDMDQFLSSQRDFLVPRHMPDFIGIKATFALGNFLNKYLR